MGQAVGIVAVHVLWRPLRYRMVPEFGTRISSHAHQNVVRKQLSSLSPQAVFNVTRARYPMPEDDLHTLAGLQAAVFAAETGQGRDVASLRPHLHQFYPQHMLSTDPKKAIKKLFTKMSAGSIPEAKGLGAQFELALQKAMGRGSEPQQLKVFYLQLCWSKPFYG